MGTPTENELANLQGRVRALESVLGYWLDATHRTSAQLEARRAWLQTNWQSADLPRDERSALEAELALLDAHAPETP